MDLLGVSVRCPLVGAPMAGGPSTPALVAAVGEAGGLGFLAAGYLSAGTMAGQIAEVRAATNAPFGVNVFVPQPPDVDRRALDDYMKTLRPAAEAAGVELEATWDDDGWTDKVEVLTADPVPVVSFTFGYPPPDVVGRLRAAGTRVVVTVTTPLEAQRAVEAGADALAVQGIEAGGHQSTFTDDVGPDAGWGLLALVTAVRHRVPVPIIAAGGLMTGSDVAAVLTAGAVAGQVGTALLRCRESGAPEVHKAALADPSFDATGITRAFSGRRARGLVNDFMRAHPHAPSAYPWINNATRGLRRQAAARGDAHGINLWAGQGFRLARTGSAAEVVAALGTELEAAGVGGA
jgi:nitronate monooxygenase